MQRIQFSESVLRHGGTDYSLRASVAVNGVAVCVSSRCDAINCIAVNYCDPLTQINDEKILTRIP